MRIRAGYEISYDCPQPTPMILQVSVHPSRMPDLISWDGLQIDPLIPANTYHDSFGNFCHVIRAPAGRLTLSTDFLVQHSGELDEVVPGAEQHPLEELPVDALIFLLGSRYCDSGVRVRRPQRGRRHALVRAPRRFAARLDDPLLDITVCVCLGAATAGRLKVLL